MEEIALKITHEPAVSLGRKPQEEYNESYPKKPRISVGKFGCTFASNVGANFLSEPTLLQRPENSKTASSDIHTMVQASESKPPQATVMCKVECCPMDIFWDNIITNPQHPKTPLAEEQIHEFIVAGRPRTSILPDERDSKSLFERFTWLAGCNTLEVVYCWSCTLYSSLEIWYKHFSEVGDYLQISEDALNHGLTTEHQDSMVLLLSDDTYNLLVLAVKSKEVYDEPYPIPSQIGIRRTCVPKPPYNNNQQLLQTTSNNKKLPKQQPNNNNKFKHQQRMTTGNSKLKKLNPIPQIAAHSEKSLKAPIEGNVAIRSTRRNMKSNDPFIREPKYVSYKKFRKTPENKQGSVEDTGNESSAQFGSISSTQVTKKCNENPERVENSDFTKTQMQITQGNAYFSMRTIKRSNDLCLIEKLLSNNFLLGSWTDYEKLKIVCDGKPRPEISKQFNVRQYDEIPWLTGFQSRRKMVCCWPCLLFGNQKPWINEYTNETDCTVNAILHENSETHQKSSESLKWWEHEISSKLSCLSKWSPDSDQETRQYLKYLVDIVSFSKSRIRKSDFFDDDVVKLVYTVSTENKDLMKVVRSKSNVEEDVRGIINSIAASMATRIIQEGKSADYVTLILTRSGLPRPWIAAIMRYVKDNGDVEERCFKIFKFEHLNLLEELEFIVTSLECENKLIGFTYDESMLTPPEAADFNVDVNNKYPTAQFFHYKSHNLRSLLKQSLSHTTYCGTFFHYMDELEEFCQVMMLARKWDEFLTFVYKDHVTLTEFLTQIICTPTDNETAAKATHFLVFLRQTTTRFLIVLLQTIFVSIEDLTRAFEKEYHVLRLKLLAEDTMDNLMSTEKLGFHYHVHLTLSKFKLTEVKSFDRNFMESVFKGVLGSAIHFLRNRTADMKNWSFFDLIIFPVQSEWMFGLASRFASRFNDKFSKEEAKLFVKQLALMKKKQHEENLDIYDLMRCIIGIDEIDSFPTSFVHTYLKVILTVPLKHTATRSTRAEMRVREYAMNKQFRNPSDALMFIEKDLLADMKKENMFYEDVMRYFLYFQAKN